MFGLTTVWRRSVKVQVSDPTRTIIDIIDDPSLGGGIRHVAEILAVYFSENSNTDQLLLENAERFGNRTVFKRLGYLLETLNIDKSFLIKECFNRKSSGYSYLDPQIKEKGKILRRWNLWINASIRTEEVYR